MDGEITDIGAHKAQVGKPRPHRVYASPQARRYAALTDRGWLRTLLFNVYSLLSDGGGVCETVVEWDWSADAPTESQGVESKYFESKHFESQGAESQGAKSQGAESQGAKSQGAESQGAESQGKHAVAVRRVDVTIRVHSTVKNTRLSFSPLSSEKCALREAPERLVYLLATQLFCGQVNVTTDDTGTSVMLKLALVGVCSRAPPTNFTLDLLRTTVRPDANHNEQGEQRGEQQTQRQEETHYSEPCHIDVLFAANPDSEMRLQVVKGMRKCGIKWVCVRSGREALDWLRDARNSCRLMVVEHFMPSLGGPATAERARKEFPSLRIIGLTSLLPPTTSYKQEAVDAVIYKPVSLDIVMQTMCTVLDAASRKVLGAANRERIDAASRKGIDAANRAVRAAAI